jgi:ribonuclease P protein component
MGEPTRRFLLRHRQRLHGSRAFRAVFAAELRKNMGPIVVCGRPNALDYNRLGLSVPRRVGTAVVRAGIKRRLREAFRLGQHDGPTGYDLVLVVRPHQRLTVAEYQNLIYDALDRINRLAAKRANHHDGPKP